MNLKTQGRVKYLGYLSEKGSSKYFAGVWTVYFGPKRMDFDSQDSFHSLRKTKYAEKIENDVFRTLKTSEEFDLQGQISRMTMILNQIAVKYGYVQGMNVMLAPFVHLFEDDLDAYQYFNFFVSKICPSFISSDMIGVYKTCEFVDKCLNLLDPELFVHLRDRNQLCCKIYGFQRCSFLILDLVTFGLSMHPFKEILKLWDFFVLFGFHLHVFCFLQIILEMKIPIM